MNSIHETSMGRDVRLVIRMLTVVVLAMWNLSAPAADVRPNILFLFADDQRADTIAALGNSVIKTPNLDRLVKRGLSFDRAYMQGGQSGATCIPSRAMLLSGRGLFHIDQNLMKGETWSAAFGKAGYQTFVSGKWHNGEASIGRSFQQARSVFVGGMTNPLQAKLGNLIDGKMSKPELASKHACEIFADEAIRFLGEQHEQPFLCYVPFDAPHDPHVVPKDFPIRYRPEDIPVPANLLPQHPWDNGEMTVRDEHLLPWPRTPHAVQEMLADYYQYISFLDAQIGRILDALDASPLGQNTIVVFSADSGVARGSHGLVGKQNCYEHSMRVPLIIAGPGIVANQRTSAMCYLFDVFPTLGQRCGVKAPTTSEGIDFSPVLADANASARSHIMLAYKEVQRSIRDAQWKLIRYPQVDRTQLFDLQNDPQEISNLAAQPEHAERVKAMLAQLAHAQADFGDTQSLTIAEPKSAAWNPPAKSDKKAAGEDQ